MEQLESINISSRSNSCRKILDGFKQKHLRKLAKESNKRLDNCSNSSKRWFDLIIDSYFSKVYIDDTKSNSKKAPKYILPIFFDNKGLEFIRLNSIIRNDEVKGKLPDQFRNDETPSVVYSLGSTIRNKILNYKDTVQNIDTNDSDTFGTGIHTCDCSSTRILVLTTPV